MVTVETNICAHAADGALRQLDRWACAVTPRTHALQLWQIGNAGKSDLGLCEPQSPFAAAGCQHVFRVYGSMIAASRLARDKNTMIIVRCQEELSVPHSQQTPSVRCTHSFGLVTWSNC